MARYQQHLSLMENQVIDTISGYFRYPIEDLFIIYNITLSFDAVVKTCKFADKSGINDLAAAYSRMIAEE